MEKGEAKEAGDYVHAAMVYQHGTKPEDYDRANDFFYGQYKAGTLDIQEYLRFALGPLAQHPRAQLDEWHRKFMDTVIRPAITPAARELVKNHLDAGDICCCVTATIICFT